MTLPRIVTDALGGSALAQRVMQGEDEDGWYLRRPATAEEWGDRAREVHASVASDWLERLSLAFGASGAARDRLERVAREGGVLVTTGQQPGLFGGPVYTWSKALSALELADEIERVTGIPTAPVFWAATDDADLAEASDTWIAVRGGSERLEMASASAEQGTSEGLPMAEYPLGDVRQQLRRLADASGSAIDPGILDTVRLSYHPRETVGGAYLTLLRVMLQPLGIGVLDASHASLLSAERPLLNQALRDAGTIDRALRIRSDALRAAGHVPQVPDVEGLSLVFGRENGRKVRVAVSDATAVLSRGASERLSPNVLLRPVLERAVLPTVAYVAGPGEIAYFAQVGAVAEALGTPVPLVVPRWSCTIVEPHIAELLDARGLRRSDLADPHAAEGRLARADAPAALLAALESWRLAIDASAETLTAALEDSPGLIPAAAVDGARGHMRWRVDRLDRRLVAALKRRDEALRRDLGTIRGALYPGGKRQERALNLLPLLARHGMEVLDAMRQAARRHAEALVHGASIPVDPA